MAKIFISYRRADSSLFAGRIYDHLIRRFGARAVFKDVDAIPPGADFAAYIAAVLRTCQVALALIGPGWLESREPDGRRRLDDPADLVRVEIETALAQGVTVIPLLLDGASMPEASQLPESLAPLTRLNALPVRQDPDFYRDMQRVVAGVEVALRAGRAKSRERSERGSASSGTRAADQAAAVGGRPARAGPSWATSGRVRVLIGAILLLLLASVAALTGTKIEQAQARQAAQTRVASANQTSAALGTASAQASATSAQAAANALATAAAAPYHSAHPSCDDNNWTVTPPNGQAETTNCKATYTWLQGHPTAMLAYNRPANIGYPDHYTGQVTVAGILGQASMILPDDHAIAVSNDGSYVFGPNVGGVGQSNTYVVHVELRSAGGTVTINGKQIGTFQPTTGVHNTLRLQVTNSGGDSSAYYSEFSFAPLP